MKEQPEQAWTDARTQKLQLWRLCLAHRSGLDKNGVTIIFFPKARKHP